jgi:uncharacterized protein (DUF4415 family)
MNVTSMASMTSGAFDTTRNVLMTLQARATRSVPLHGVANAIDPYYVYTLAHVRVEPMAKRSGSSARARRAGRKGEPTKKTRRRIDYSDIPPLSDEQLASMRRVGRPRLGRDARQSIAIRIDPAVLEQLRHEAKRRNTGYQTLINEVLARYVKHVASRSSTSPS